MHTVSAHRVASLDEQRRTGTIICTSRLKQPRYGPQLTRQSPRDPLTQCAFAWHSTRRAPRFLDLVMQLEPIPLGHDTSAAAAGRTPRGPPAPPSGTPTLRPERGWWGPPDLHVVHAWGGSFAGMVAALREHCAALGRWAEAGRGRWDAFGCLAREEGEGGQETERYEEWGRATPPHRSYLSVARGRRLKRV